MAETLNTHSSQPNPEQQNAQEQHEQEMLAKAEKLEQAGQERPDWLPEKFSSVEQMAQAYGELEKKLGQPKEETTTTEEAPQQTNESATEVVEVLDKAGLNFDEFQSEYNEKGGLSEEAYKKLDQAGFSKSLVDSWIQGQEALASGYQNQVYNMVGGEQSYVDMVTWASDNLPDHEITAFNTAIDSGDINQVQFAVNGLAARYRTEVGTEPNLVQGNASTNTGGTFQSTAELTAAMSDPRYQKDPAYRKAVSDKLARSSVF